MAKEKLFKPEDFDKPKDKSFWHKCKGLIFGILVLLIIVALCFIFCDKKEDSAELHQLAQTAQVENVNTTAESETLDSSLQEVNRSSETETLESDPTSTQEIETLKKGLVQKNVKPQISTLPTNISDNIEQEALSVIRGDYGNVPERRERLGSKYQEIQNRVNQLKRKGAF